jgi:hypothetical protein
MIRTRFGIQEYDWNNLSMGSKIRVRARARQEFSGTIFHGISEIYRRKGEHICLFIEEEELFTVRPLEFCYSTPSSPGFPEILVMPLLLISRYAFA